MYNSFLQSYLQWKFTKNDRRVLAFMICEAEINIKKDNSTIGNMEKRRYQTLTNILYSIDVVIKVEF